jgi:hypothetical protein
MEAVSFANGMCTSNLEIRTMDEVHKLSDSECYMPLSESSSLLIVIVIVIVIFVTGADTFW